MSVHDLRQFVRCDIRFLYIQFATIAWSGRIATGRPWKNPSTPASTKFSLVHCVNRVNGPESRRWLSSSTKTKCLSAGLKGERRASISCNYGLSAKHSESRSWGLFESWRSD